MGDYIPLSYETISGFFDEFVQRLTEKIRSNKRSDNTLKKCKTTRSKMDAFLRFAFPLKPERSVLVSQVEVHHAEDLYHYLTTEEDIEHNSAMKCVSLCLQVFKFAVGC